VCGPGIQQEGRREIEQLVKRLHAELWELKDEKAARRSGAQTTTAGDVDPRSLDRVNAARIDKLVHDILLAPAGTEPGFNERRRLAERLTVRANFDFDPVDGNEKLRGEKWFKVRLNDGEEAMCWPDKHNPAEVAYHFSSDWRHDRPQEDVSYKSHLLLAVTLTPPDKPHYEFHIRCEGKDPNHGGSPTHD
jgi:hypothetical protein